MGALRSAGIPLEPLEQTFSSGPGVVFIDERTPELDAALATLSNHGRVRVLAVLPERSALSDADAWALLGAGVADVLEFDPNTTQTDEIVARLERWSAVDRLIESPLVRDNLLGSSPAWTQLLREIVEVAYFSDAPVLILGESGTGKELIARLIHSLDPRPGKRDLVVLDCTTVHPELAGSEFFGHERGAFTGAVGSRDGAFALANEGTLFLDEIGDLSLPLQAQLLRAIQEKSFKRVGGNVWQRSSFRLVCATHRRLDDAVEQGEFRADLFYRLGGVLCRVPPLRERPEDVILLFRHFVAEFAGLKTAPELDLAVERVLLGRRYQGNVRELQQLARRTTCRHVGEGNVSVGDLPDDVRPAAAPERLLDDSFDAAVRRALTLGIGLKEISRQAADAAIRVAVSEATGNLQEAARQLGVTDRALQMRRASGWGIKEPATSPEPRH